MMVSITAAVAALAAAVIAHGLLLRLRRRIEAWGHRRRRAGRSTGVVRMAGVALLVLQWLLWLLALRIASDAHPWLAAARVAAITELMRALDAPLFELSQRPVTALHLLAVPLVFAALWFVVGGITHVLRASLLRALDLEGGSEQTVAGLLRYALLFFGILLVLHLAGVDVASLAIAGGVLGIGIGFGLQHIANNFVSGILIGLERPVRPGDFVRVGEHVGTVLRIGARSTALRTLDRVTILIPNARFLETDVVNWSIDDPTTRLHVPVGVAYGSDVAVVRAALLAAARGHPAVLRDPRPQVQMQAFGSSSLQFELLVWTRDPRNQAALVSDLNYRIELEFRRHGVEVPFDQVDVHLRNPEVLAALLALAGRTGAGAQEPAPVPARPPPAQPQELPREDRSPESWTTAEVEAVAVRMRAPGGVDCRDRRYLLRVYRDCFVGSEAVDWLARHEALTRNEARLLGERFVELGFVRHVLDEHGFLDGYFYYRFCDAMPPPGDDAAGSVGNSTRPHHH
jgi:small-conductance mechanosensitive channel